MFDFIGQPATVSARPTVTWPPAISTARTMSSSTTLRRISGSMTATSAVRMSASEGTRESYRLSAVDQPGQASRHGVVPGGGDPRPGNQIEREVVVVGQQHGGTRLAHDQRGGGDVDRPRRLEGADAVQAPVGQLAQRERQGAEQADA